MNNSQFTKDVGVIKTACKTQMKFPINERARFPWIALGGQRYFPVEYIRTRPKSFIKIPTFSRNLLFTIIIMRREVSFRLRQAHDETRNEILDRR